MPGLIARRLLDAIPTILLVLVLVFFSLRILPGDPAQVALGDQATPQQLSLFRHQMGLDVPLIQQFFTFLRNIITLDFGKSLINGIPVSQLVAQNLPYTIELTLVATAIGTLAGVPMGIMAALSRNRFPDHAARLYSLIGYAIPDFYLGAVLLIVFALDLKWFPVNGGGVGVLDSLYHVLLPAITLAALKSAFLGRLTRGTMLDVLGKDYVRTARAKGAREPRVIYIHALRNALLPLTTGLGLSILSTLSGAVAVELVFNRPGIGSLLINAIGQRDYPVIEAGVAIFAFLVVLINLAVDLAYVLIDPRVRAK